MSIINKFLIIILILILFVGTVKIHAQSDWKYNAGIYGWFAGLKGTVGIANLDQQIDASVSELLKNLKFTAGGHFEARNPLVSLIADVFYVGIGKDAQVSIQTPLSRMEALNGSVNLDEWIIEGAAGYRISEVFEVLVASRLYSISVDISVQNNNPTSSNKTWADIFLGARYSTNFAKKWYASLRVDAGLGGSKFAWFGNATIGYRFSKLFSIAIAYRILSLDYDSGSGIDYFKYDVTTLGFGLAAVFSF